MATLSKNGFIHLVAGLKSNEHINVPCSCGSHFKIEKAKYPLLNFYYFEKGSIQPKTVSTADFSTLKHLVLNAV